MGVVVASVQVVPEIQIRRRRIIEAPLVPVTTRTGTGSRRELDEEECPPWEERRFIDQPSQLPLCNQRYYPFPFLIPRSAPLFNPLTTPPHLVTPTRSLLSPYLSYRIRMSLSKMQFSKWIAHSIYLSIEMREWQREEEIQSLDLFPSIRPVCVNFKFLFLYVARLLRSALCVCVLEQHLNKRDRPFFSFCIGSTGTSGSRRHGVPAEQTRPLRRC